MLFTAVLIDLLSDLLSVIIQVKSKAVHEGAWGEWRYSSYSFLTSALDEGKWSALRSGRDLHPGKVPPVPIA
jgi:hypothetical protein